MRKLKIDFTDLEGAFEFVGFENGYFFDTETGEVLMVQDDMRRQMEQLLEEAGPDATLDDVLREADFPEWQKEAMKEAWRVEERFGLHCIRVPQIDASEDYDDMATFTELVQNPSLRRQIERAIEGRGAFRRFKNLVHGDFREREHWFAFKRERLRERITDWLASKGIEPVWQQSEAIPAPRPPAREHLLEGVLAFVRAALRLDGVKRIALIGSLATEEPNPKDADLLVTVTEEMDLAPLAKLGRRLGGHAQQLGRGADVFLAGLAGQYLGRTCHWRECAPGIRMSCDALHCGQRHYLHDDLRSVQLDSKLLIAPPIEFWPALVARASIPPDVERCVLTPLRAGFLEDARSPFP